MRGEFHLFSVVALGFYGLRRVVVVIRKKLFAKSRNAFIHTQGVLTRISSTSSEYRRPSTSVGEHSILTSCSRGLLFLLFLVASSVFRPVALEEHDPRPIGS